MFNLGPFEIGVIGFVALLIFGNRLPGVAKSMGQGVHEFKKALRGLGEESVDKRPAPADPIQAKVREEELKDREGTAVP